MPDTDKELTQDLGSPARVRETGGLSTQGATPDCNPPLSPPVGDPSILLPPEVTKPGGQATAESTDMERGYFKVWRKIKDSSVWSMGANHLGVWVAILAHANWQEKDWKQHTIKPGEFVCGVESFGKDLGLSRQSIRTVLKNLVQLEMIKCENLANRSTKIIVLNWQMYQPTDQPRPNQPLTNHQPTANQPLTTTKELKNGRIKEVKKERTNTVFVPPTVLEVAEYCRERGNSIDPEYFVASYEKSGWVMKGGQKVKNWKACIITWEKNKYNQPASQPNLEEKRVYISDPSSEPDHAGT